jgi:SM-20-related protein
MVAHASATAVRPAPPAPFAGPLFDWSAFDAAPLVREPFDFLIVPGFIGPAALEALNRDFPAIEGPGNAAPEDLDYGSAFAALLDELYGDALRDRFAAKFRLDLEGAEATIAVRRHCEATDGHIHTDHRAKLITVLLYFNEDWPHEGGRLRMLRSASDLDDYAAEVVPAAGNLLAFRRSDNSFHGHKRFVGERRILQLSFARPSVLVDAQRRIGRLTKPIRRLLNLS